MNQPALLDVGPKPPRPPCSTCGGPRRARGRCRPCEKDTMGRRIIVLCPHGHVIESMRAREWAGSLWEARAGDPSWVVECGGALALPPPSRIAVPTVRIAVEQVRVDDGGAEEEAAEIESALGAQEGASR